MTNQMPERIYIGMDGRWHNSIRAFDQDYRGTEYIRADIAQKTVTREDLGDIVRLSYIEWAKRTEFKQLTDCITEAIITANLVKVSD